ncbi:DndE family protein [Natroniella sulfidigena]|uniref:DndE family protein n=1 Tax=Natroniella sulfidigena TaxID=723921 RepID=UPI00200A551E|nr:DndE family protein [Natroniella sulfidigena]MCK8817160.1 DndE family protein [Natroniella sulfidigena]
MKFRLKTSAKTKEVLKEIQARSNLRPNILSRIAINLSLVQDDPVKDQEYDNNGLEFPRNVLLGEYDQLYKALISQRLGRHIKEEEYFPNYVKLHLERGTRLLKNEYNYAGNFETFVKNLINNKIG